MDRRRGVGRRRRGDHRAAGHLDPDALGNITDALADVANFVYLSGGTTALRKGSPIERLVRDVHTGTQHITSGPGMWRAAGEELAGAAGNKQWVLLDLVDVSAPS